MALLRWPRYGAPVVGRATVLGATVLLVACRFEAVPPPPPFDVPRPAAPVPLRLAVAPVRMAPDLNARAEGAVHLSRPDPAELREGVVDALRAWGAFARVAARGTSQDGTAAVDSLVWAERDDLVLELTVQDAWSEYRGHSNYVGWFIAYAAAIWPAWWVPVDYYGVGLRVQARLRGLARGVEPLLERTFFVSPQETQQELTPSDRELVGFLDWAALWNVQASLDDSNWRAIERAVGPHARRAVEQALGREVAERVARPLTSGSPVEREQVLRRARKRFALVVGVSSYADGGLGGGGFAAGDARALAATLGEPRGGGLVEGRELHLLLDEQATRAAVLDAIAAVASRAAPTDEVLVCLGALGASLDGGAPAVLLHDASAADLPATALALTDLGAALAAVPAERLLLVLDGSFEGSLDGLAAALRLAPGRAALLAARPGQSSRGLPSARTGLFADVLRRTIGGAGDVDGDGRVTLSEAYEHLRATVLERAALEGFEQEPAAIGLEGAAGLGWPR